MASRLFLGKRFDPVSRALGEEFQLDPSDFTTHGLIVGMTGSGKTGFSTVIIEECLRAGIPVLAVDPKGDLANLGLAFDRLAPEQFLPWVDAVQARREGKHAEAAAEETAALWRRGLADWGIGEADIGRYVGGHELRVITPGSAAGIPLNLIDSLEPPPPEVMADEEELRDQVDAVITALLGLVRIDADPIRSREYMLLYALVDSAWREGRGLTLEALVASVAQPPFERMGALPLESVFPARDRHVLMLALNGLVASPPFAAWRMGEPADIENMLHAADGRPRLTIVYTAHLDDEQRLFVTAFLLNRLKSWMRRQRGTGELRCLFYMDEIFGYFPPVANPPTKKPLITLLKQARAYGVGVLLATQNPVDLDYKGLSNMGFWAVGRLQTSQDQARVREGIEAALADAGLGFDFDDLVAGVQKRVFLVHDIHRRAPELVHTRWAISYLRGPLTREEIERLVEVRGSRAAGAALAAGPARGGAPGGPPTGVQARAPAQAVAPALPGLQTRFWPRHGGDFASPFLYVRTAVRYRAGGSMSDESVRDLAFPLGGAGSLAEVMQSEPLAVSEEALESRAPARVSFAELPAFVQAEGARGIERALRDRLDDRLAMALWYDAPSKMLSFPGEEPGAFALRVQAAPGREKRRTAVDKRLEQKRLQLSARRAETKSRRLEKWTALGTAILSNVGLFTGRKRTVTGAGSVLTKSRMESTSEARVEQLEAEVQRLEAEAAELVEVDPSRFEVRTVKPSRTDVAILRMELVWVY